MAQKLLDHLSEITRTDPHLCGEARLWAVVLLGILQDLSGGNQAISRGLESAWK
jgi:hypothetical protein